MAELLLVNPSRRRRGKRTKTRRRRKMSALQRQYFGRRRRKSNPHPRRSYRRRRHVARISRRRRRSNPSFRGLTSGLLPQLKAGFMGALGGLGLDVLMGQVSSRLPAQLQSGWGLNAVKLAGALAVGFVGGKVLRGRGTALTQGAMTVVLHDILKQQLQSAVPTLPLGEYMTFAPAVGYGPGAAPVLSTGLGEYMTMNGYETSGNVDYGDHTVYGGGAYGYG